MSFKLTLFYSLVFYISSLKIIVEESNMVHLYNYSQFQDSYHFFANEHHRASLTQSQTEG